MVASARTEDMSRTAAASPDKQTPNSESMQAEIDLNRRRAALQGRMARALERLEDRQIIDRGTGVQRGGGRSQR